LNTIKFSPQGANAVCIGIDALDRLLRENNAPLSLLYLHILRSADGFSLENAAAALNIPAEEAEALVFRLTALGLVLPNTESKALSAERDVPDYSAKDITKRAGEDLGFRIVVSETQRIFGRMLGSQELKQLFGIYDNLGLPSEVMLMLVNYCVTDYSKKYGPGRLPSLRSIEKEGIYWADNEILTLDLAEEYTKRKRERSDTMYQLRRAVGLSSRELSASEKKYAESWIEMGFPVESIAIAYDRTVLKTGSLKWSYMNTIIKNWHEKGLHTPAEIKEQDSLKAYNRKSPDYIGHTPILNSEHADGSKELKRAKKIIDMINNG